MSNYRGIDIFNGSGAVDFPTAINAGLKFCIARCGYGSDRGDQDDEQFQRNYDQCKALGIPLGSYFYTYALNVAGTESEKAHIKRLLAGKSFELPVFVDMEDADGYKARHGGIPDAQTNTDIVKSLCEYIKSLGFAPGFYCNKDWAENHLIMSQLSGYAFYYARPGVAQPDKPCYLWQDQTGSTGGHFPGVQGDAMGKCDTDILIGDLPTKAPQPSASAPAPISHASTPTASSNANVRVAQQFYNARGAGIAEDGIYGPATRKALIMSVQRGCNQAYGSGLVVDGIFGDKTLGAIRTLRNGDDNSAVWSLQAGLMAHGYATNGIDGKFGSGTESAVRSFQNASALSIDGLAGKNTFTALCR